MAISPRPDFSEEKIGGFTPPNRQISPKSEKLKEWIKSKNSEIWYSTLSGEEKSFMCSSLIKAVKNRPPSEDELHNIGDRISGYIKVNDFVTQMINVISKGDISDDQKELLSAYLREQGGKLMDGLRGDRLIGARSVESWVNASLEKIEKGLQSPEAQLYISKASLPVLATSLLTDKETTELFEKSVNPLLHLIQTTSLSNETKFLLSDLLHNGVTLQLKQFRANRDPEAFENEMKQIKSQVASICECSLLLHALIAKKGTSEYANSHLRRFLDNSLHALIHANLPAEKLEKEIDALIGHVERALTNLKKFHTQFKTLALQEEEIKQLRVDERAKEVLVTSFAIKTAPLIDKMLGFDSGKVSWYQTVLSIPTAQMTKLANAARDASKAEIQCIKIMEAFKSIKSQEIDNLPLPAKDKRIYHDRLQNGVEDLYLDISLQEEYQNNWNSFVRNFEYLIGSSP